MRVTAIAFAVTASIILIGRSTAAEARITDVAVNLASSTSAAIVAKPAAPPSKPVDEKQKSSN